MEANRQPYPRSERKHGKFIIEKVSEKRLILPTWLRFINWMARKPKPTKIETKFLILNKAKGEYNWVDQIKQSNYFAFDEACKIARQLPEKDPLTIKLVKYDGKQFITV